MQKGGFRSAVKVSLLLMAVLLLGATTASAETLNSANYQVTGSEFNSISSSETCSAQYCAKVSIGNISDEESRSANYAIGFGPIYEGEPSIDVIVEPGLSDLGSLSAEQTGTKLLKLKVRSYLSAGYIIQVTGTPPSYEGKSLPALSSPTESQTGVEQFGLNIVANDQPKIGANPEQTPAGSLDLTGLEINDYNQVNKFKYTSGDTIARNQSPSSDINYTISMIVNISGNTPAGRYASDLTAIVTPLY